MIVTRSRWGRRDHLVVWGPGGARLGWQDLSTGETFVDDPGAATAVGMALQAWTGGPVPDQLAFRQAAVVARRRRRARRSARLRALLLM